MKVKRTQILMEPKEYQQLESIARQEKVSVAELIRKAVRERYLRPEVNRAEIIDRILSMELPITEDWEVLEREIEDAHIHDLP